MNAPFFRLRTRDKDRLDVSLEQVFEQRRPRYEQRPAKRCCSQAALSASR